MKQGLVNRSLPGRLGDASSNPDAIFGLQIELVGGQDVEGFVPGVYIANCVATVFSWGVGVGCDLFAKSGFVLNFAPALGKGQEEALFAICAVDHDIGLALQGQEVGVMRHQQACDVCDVFAQDLLAFDAKIGQRAVSVELCC